MFDIAFIEFNEPNAEENFRRLRSIAPWARKVQGIPGILNAHKLAAEECNTEYFYVVDADTWMYNTFDFTFKPAETERHLKSTYIWWAQNPCNGLEYGHGGVKLFHRKTLADNYQMPLDLTTSISNTVVIKETISYHMFNTDPFTTWRTAFRECVKLTLKYDLESIERLDHWVGEAYDTIIHSGFCLLGAQAGQEFAEANFHDEQTLQLINNYKWLKEQFTHKYPHALQTTPT